MEVPDVAWISQERLEALIDEAGHLTGAPEVVVEVYRRAQSELQLVATLLVEDTLTTPLLPGFACSIERFFT